VLRTQKAKNPKAFALRVFVVAGAINQPSELLLRGTAKDCCVTQTTAVLGSVPTARQTDADRSQPIALPRWDIEQILCVNTFVCISASSQISIKRCQSIWVKMWARNLLATGNKR